MSKLMAEKFQYEAGGWEWFQSSDLKVNSRTNSDQMQGDAKRFFARCFSTPEGQKVLAHLKTLTLERTLGPNATDSMLRHLEGQRQLVSYIDNLTEQGRSANN
ncbi:MAG: hypothetical protein OQK35_05665 [Alphaproteobacteria bacterium]|nr:hypothetical protein [Rhodospirillales bacterium]MCW9045802.1 hypothetical protein [Alphaproteobacteria bacterium]